MQQSNPLVKAAKPRRKTSIFQQLMSIHWWMAACFLLLFILGIVMPRLSEEMPIREQVYAVHKSLGALVLGLLLVRIFVLLRVSWSKYSRRLPKLTPDWIKVFALHSALYVFMLAAPLSGFFLSNSYRSGNVPFFGLTLPDLFPVNRAVVELARSLHFWLVYAFLAASSLHLLQQWKVVRASWRRALSATKNLVKS